MAENNPNWKRSTYLIDRPFQYKYTSMVVGLGLIIYLIVAGDKGIEGSKALPSGEGSKLEQEMKSLKLQSETGDSKAKQILVGTGVLFIVLLFIFGIIVTHRIAGPIYYIGTLLDQLQNGQTPDTRPLRKRDEFKTFFGQFAKMVDTKKQESDDNLSFLESFAGDLEKAGVDAELTDRLKRFVQAKKDS